MKIEEISQSQNIADNQKCVLDFIKDNYKKINDLSLRTYSKALQLFVDDPKRWKEKFMSMIGFDEKLIQYLTLKWSRATFFRVRQELGDYQ